MADFSSMLNPEMMSQLLQQAGQMGQFGQHGQFQGRYNNQPITGAGMFSFTRAMQPFGEMGESVGSLLDFGGMTGVFGEQFQHFRSSLQGFRGVDPMLVAREQSMMQARAALSTGISGVNVAKAFGFKDTSSGMGQFISQSAGMLSMMSPEFRSAIDVFTPGAMTSGGGELASAVQMQDMMQRINPNNVDSMRRAFMERTMSPDGKSRQNDRTAGLNLDDFAQVVRFAQDTGVRDTSLTEESPEFKERVKTIIDKKVAELGKAFDKSALKGIEEEARGQVGQEALVRGGEFQAGITRAMSRTFGLTTGESLQVMRDNGIVAGDAKSGANITEAINRIEALGRAAGMTSQDLINAGRAVQQQYGGSFIAGAQLAAEAQATERMSSAPGHQGQGAANTQRIISQTKAEEQGLVANTLMAGLMSRDASLRKTAEGLVGRTGSDAEYAELERLVAHDSTATMLQARMATDPQTRAAAIEQLGSRFGHTKLLSAISDTTQYGEMQSLSAAGKKYAAGLKNLSIGDLERLRNSDLNLAIGGGEGGLQDVMDKLGLTAGQAGQLASQRDILVKYEHRELLKRRGTDPDAFVQTRAEGDAMAARYQNRQQAVVGLLASGNFSPTEIGKALGIVGDENINELMKQYSIGSVVSQGDINALAGHGAIASGDRTKYMGAWSAYKSAAAAYDKAVAAPAGTVSADDISKLKQAMEDKASIGAQYGVDWTAKGSWNVTDKQFTLENGSKMVDQTGKAGAAATNVTANTVNHFYLDGKELNDHFAKLIKQTVETTVNGKTSPDQANGQARKGGSGANSSRMT